MIIYIYGCNCGTTGTHVRRVKKLSGEPVKVENSRFNDIARKEHAAYLRLAGFDPSSYSPIVVDGDKITLLRLWNL